MDGSLNESLLAPAAAATTTRSETMSVLKGTASYVFDDLSFKQAEDMLSRHGADGAYLVTHFHDPESFGVSIRLREGEELVYKHYPVCISGRQLYAEGVSGAFRNIEEVVEAIQEQVATKLVAIFNSEKDDMSITVSCDDAPPEYNKAAKFPVAARRHLPIIVPIRPTIRRMMGSSADPQSNTTTLPEDLEPVPLHIDTRNRSCCWKAFHTDPEGAWYKPHKAGIITAIFLILGWLVFLALFGWIIALALVLVFILVMCAYLLNFICTGRCQIEEDDDPSVMATVSR